MYIVLSKICIKLGRVVLELNSILKGKRGVSRSPYISQRMFPTWESLNNMREFTEQIKNEQLKNIICLGLCTGYRIGELCNSYAFFDSPEKNSILIRTIAQKKRKIAIDEDGNKIKYTDGVKKGKFKRVPLVLKPSNVRGFIGKDILELQIKDKIWKSVKLTNFFDVSVGFLGNSISPSIYEPEWLFPNSDYNKLFRLLKAVPEQEVFYFPNAKLEEPIRVMAKPCFHFFRKAVASKMIQMTDIMSVVNFMHWEDINTTTFYSKLYKFKTFDDDVNMGED